MEVEYEFTSWMVINFLLSKRVIVAELKLVTWKYLIGSYWMSNLYWGNNLKLDKRP